MIYRPYGKTGRQVSLLGFGGMRFKEIDNRDLCVEMMLEAARGGVTYFDTAPDYFGVKSEEVFGAGFEEMKRQGLPFTCSTKTFAAGEKEIRAEIEAQLRRLGLSKIDFYHAWCITSLSGWQDRKSKGLIQTFRKLREEGLIDHICVSSHLVGDEIHTLLQEEVFEGVLIGYSAANFSFRQKAFETIAARDLGCAVMNPLYGGIIPSHPQIFEFLRTRENQTVVEAALQFLFSQPGISTVLVGFGTLAEVREAVQAVDNYREGGTAEIERIKEHLSRSFQNLCTGCQYCEPCPHGVPVSRMMDAWNHGKLYGTRQAILDRLKWHWHFPPSDAARCVACGQCEEQCTQHLPIIERLQEIAAPASGKSANTG